MCHHHHHALIGLDSQLTDDDGHSRVAPHRRLPPRQAVQGRRQVGLGAQVGTQLRNQVVVVGVEELGPGGSGGQGGKRTGGSGGEVESEGVGARAAHKRMAENDAVTLACWDRQGDRGLDRDDIKRPVGVREGCVRMQQPAPAQDMADKRPHPHSGLLLCYVVRRRSTPRSTHASKSLAKRPVPGEALTPSTTPHTHDPQTTSLKSPTSSHTSRPATHKARGIAP